MIRDPRTFTDTNFFAGSGGAVGAVMHLQATATDLQFLVAKRL